MRIADALAVSVLSHFLQMISQIPIGLFSQIFRAVSMSQVVGELGGLKSSHKNSLERLCRTKTGPRDLVDPLLLKQAVSVCSQLGRQLALLISRNGQCEYVCVGDKDRLYLPDLSKFRQSPGQLRRLRLVVFLPDGHRYMGTYQPDYFLASSKQYPMSGTSIGVKNVSSPQLPADFITDLEKLRLDCVLGIALANERVLGVSLINLQPVYSHKMLADNSAIGIAVRNASSVYDLEIDFEGYVDELDKSFGRRYDKAKEADSEKAVLIGAYTSGLKEAENSIDELRELCFAAGVEVVDTVIQRRRSLDPKTIIGQGKVEEVVLHCLDLGADLLIFDRELSPSQLRRITNLTELRVVDRSMLILDIFAQRASSSDGRLQVELAQLKYSLPRLTDRDSGLSRLTGGIGGRGPGETKLEIGRRRARQRIAELESRIERLSSQRGLRRQRRQDRGVPVVAIVGYTNAGKSTLLNAITKAKVLTEDRMFATLDPTSKRMRFPNDKEVVFVDTVGFIRELPKELVSAFRATLEEVGEADLVIHVLDASSPEILNQLNVVSTTLEDLGFADTPRLLILNKVDLVSKPEMRILQKSTGGIPISAVERSGLSIMMSEVEAKLADRFQGPDPE